MTMQDVRKKKNERPKKMLKKSIDRRNTSHHTAPHRMADKPLINKTVRLSEDQIAGLQEEARLDHRDSWTSLVRIAVDEMLEARRQRRLRQKPQEAAA
jgi:hypothetical protein